jgi:hypothetical protein
MVNNADDWGGLDIEPEEPSWAERAAREPALRSFVDAEIARGGIDVHVARAEEKHWRRTAVALDTSLKALTEKIKALKPSELAELQRELANHQRYYKKPREEGLL